MKILFGVQHRTHREIALHEAEGLKARGHSTRIFTYGNRGKEHFILRLVRIMRAGMEARRLVKSNDIDLLYLNSAFDVPGLIRDVITLFLVRGTGVTTFIKMHGSETRLLGSRNPLVRTFLRFLRTWCDGMGLLSTEEHGLFQNAGFPGERSVIQKNIIHPSEYRPVQNLPALHGVSTSDTVLLYAGRLLPAKGVLDILEAARLLKQRGRPFVLVFMGDGPLRSELAKKSRAWGLDAEVRFTGHIAEAETRGYYAAARVLVFPTYFDEGLPMAILHALAAGLPIVTTRIRAAADYLREDTNCLWVPPRDPGALASAVERLMDDFSLREAISSNNRTLAICFTRDVVCKELDAALTTLFEKRRSAPTSERGTR